MWGIMQNGQHALVHSVSCMKRMCGRGRAHSTRGVYMYQLGVHYHGIYTWCDYECICMYAMCNRELYAFVTTLHTSVPTLSLHPPTHQPGRTQAARQWPLAPGRHQHRHHHLPRPRPQQRQHSPALHTRGMSLHWRFPCLFGRGW